MGQNQPSGNTQGSTVPVIPKYLQGIKPSEEQALIQQYAAQTGLPSIGQLYGMTPLEGTAPLTGAQLGTINQYTGMNTGPNAPQTAGINTLSNFANGPIGQDPAAIAGEQSFSQLAGPQIQQQANLQGQGNSGAALEANAIGNTSALAPYLQSAESNQLSAGNSLVGAGSTLNTQQLNDMSAQLQAEGIPQQEAQQIATNLYNQQQQQVSYASGVQSGPLSTIPSLLGQSSVQLGTGRTSPSK